MEYKNYIQKTDFGKIKLYQADCMEMLPQAPDKYYDLCICDPPYGIGENGGRNLADRPTVKWKNPSSQIYKTFDDSKPPEEKYFKELQRISKNQIVWGANNFTKFLPFSTGWVVWDKIVDEKEHLSMCELAYTSFNIRCLKFTYLWAGFKKAEQIKRIHPTQKPVALYKWLLSRYANPGDKILDTHGGSMSIAIACHDLGFDLDLYEIDKDYFEAGKQRLERHQQQQMFEFNTSG